jgi:hypothetical protein
LQRRVRRLVDGPGEPLRPALDHRHRLRRERYLISEMIFSW